MENTTSIWIDALDFQTQGGWKYDSQFVHLMGSAYLIAANEPGVPVDDAVACVNIQRSGTYRIWVRSRNWLRTFSPGKFTLLVNGEDKGVILGQQPSDAWVWEIAGDYELDAGEATISLHDLSGYFGRCASVIVTNDFDFVPSREISRMHAQRAAIKGLHTGIMEGGNYDIIVAGGGPGGVPAAIAAARMGMQVLLLQNRPMLGGNGSSENGITFDGAAIYTPFYRETGIAEELRRLRDADPELKGDWTRALEKLVANEPNLTVLCNKQVCDVQMKNDKNIDSVITLDTVQLTKCKFIGKIFIDCTGDGWVGYYAGAAYRFGREPEWQHGESLAPSAPDTQTMSGCIHGDHETFYTESDTDVEFHAPEWVPKLPADEHAFGRVISGKGKRMSWWLEAPNTYDDMWDGEIARDALMLVILGYYDHIKNKWKYRDRAKNLRFNFATISDGRRESRRFIGDYILTQNDCMNGTKFEDAVSYSGWTLDIHHPEGIYSGSKGPLYCAVRVNRPMIPFRCLYSKNIDNLMFAGRNISVSHIALGTVRVQNTIATLGQAVGTAAAMCIRFGETPRELGRNHIVQLQQQLIKDDQFIPGFKNKDPGDPCLRSTVTASSTSTTEVFRDEHGTIGPLLPLDTSRIMRFGISRRHGDIQQFYLRLHSSSPEPRTVTMHVRSMGGDVDSFSEPGEVQTIHSTVPPMGESWVRFPVHLDVEENPYIERFSMHLWVDPAEDISWRTIENLSYHTAAGTMDNAGNKKMTAGWCYAVRVDEPNDQLANCAPDNVVNGYSRIINNECYEWVSDPNESLPQWIELAFDKEQINTVSVVFDTDLTNPGTVFGQKRPGVPECVRDYSIEVFDGEAWTEVADICDNFMRKRKHSFGTICATKIRVNVKKTWGDPSARIMEVRAALEN